MNSLLVFLTWLFAVCEIREILILFAYQCLFDVVCVGPRGRRGCSVWVDTADESEAFGHISVFCLWGWAVFYFFSNPRRDRKLFSDFTMLNLCFTVEFFCLLRLNLFASFCSSGLSVTELMVLHREDNDDGVAFWDCIRWSIEAEAPKFVLKGKNRSCCGNIHYFCFFPELWMFHFFNDY